MPVPLTVIASVQAASGLALAHDPSDALFGVLVDAYYANASITRLYNRLGEGAAPDTDQGAGATFTTHFVPLAGLDWRPAMSWMRAAFPPYFLPSSLLGNNTTTAVATDDPPASPPASLTSGLGLYSCADASDMNASFLSSAAATTVWDAHFFWPYQGMFLPPNATWASNTGGGEETACGTWSHGDVASFARINASYASARAVGLRTLSYFNLFRKYRRRRCSVRIVSALLICTLCVQTLERM